MTILRTHKLKLVPLSIGALEKLVRTENTLEEKANAPLSVRSEVSASLKLSLALCQQQPEHLAWHTVWKIERRGDHRWVGSAVFAGPPDAQGRVIVGYWMDERFWGQGYMTEALAALCGWAFQNPSTKRVLASARKGHTASERVLEKNGFRPDGQWQGHPQWSLARPADL